jgi:four helix bundle protein
VPPNFIPPYGGYEDLLSFQKARTVYDGTVRFCERFLAKYGDRTRDQMVQAARSGKQNILEGSKASGTSKEAEIKLVNVARASLEELLEDYRIFCESATSRFGKRTVAKRCLSGDSALGRISPMSHIRPISKPAPRL